MKKGLIIAATLLMVLVSTGCKTHVRIPILWSGPDDTWQTVFVAIDVGPDGAKHLLRADCTTDKSCKLIYEKTYNGEPSAITQTYVTETWSPSDFIPAYISPDIAVADDGVVYIVWHYFTKDGHVYDCWNTIAADGTASDNNCNKLNDTLDSTLAGHPKVITYGNVAYSVYEIDTGSGEALYYRQLNPLNDSCGKVTVDPDGGSNDSPSLAVSSYVVMTTTKYVLHVAWSNNDGGAGSRSVYNSNYGTSGDMVNQQMSPDTGMRSDPVILAIQSYNRLYFVTREEGTPDILATAYCVLPDCPVFNGTDNILDSTDNWDLSGNPDMALGYGNSVLVSFLGANDITRASTTYPEIFRVTYSAGDSGPNTASRITSNDVEETDPRIANESPWQVIAWRLKGSTAGSFRDFYIYDNYSGAARPLFLSPADVAFSGFFDIASRGIDFGGIFIDQASATETWHYPWVTFNNETYYLPVITKP